MTKESAIKQFTSLKGIGNAKAELIYSHGFTTIDKLKKATVENLKKIQGITEKNAQDILRQLQEIADSKPVKTKEKKVKEINHVVKEKKEEDISERKPDSEELVEIVDETTEEYKTKKKPTLSNDQKEKLQLRKKIKRRTPTFLREEWFRYKRVPKNWRRPDGITSKMRINLKYRPSKVRVGFRGPKGVRGLHSSGFEEIMVYNLTDLEKVNPKKQAVRIGSTVGTKKRLEIAKKAEELEIRILNMKV